MQTIKIKVTPKAKKDEIFGFKDGVLRVKISAPPVQGRANDALIKFLAKEFDIAKSDIHIIRGEASREKILEIPNNIAIRQNVLI